MRAAAGHLQSGAGVQHSPNARHSWGFKPLAPCLSCGRGGRLGARISRAVPQLCLSCTVLCCGGGGGGVGGGKRRRRLGRGPGHGVRGRGRGVGCVVRCCAVPPHGSGLGLGLGLGLRLDPRSSCCSLVPVAAGSIDLRRQRWERARRRWHTKSGELGGWGLGCEGGDAGAAFGGVLGGGGQVRGTGRRQPGRRRARWWRAQRRGRSKGGAGEAGGLRARCRGRIRGPLPAAVARAEVLVGGGEAVRAEGYRQRCGKNGGLRAAAAAARTRDWATAATERRERAVATLASVVGSVAARAVAARAVAYLARRRRRAAAPSNRTVLIQHLPNMVRVARHSYVDVNKAGAWPVVCS